MAKSLAVAYLLWPFGLHHLYLGRDLQWFLWLSSCGGFWLGAIRDLFRLPEYVDARNKDEAYVAVLEAQSRTLGRPRSSLGRIIGQILFAVYYGSLFATALAWFEPESVPLFNDSGEPSGLLKPTVSAVVAYGIVRRALRALGAVLGVSLVGHVGGTQKVPSHRRLLVAALSTELLEAVFAGDSVFITAIGALAAWHSAREWNLDALRGAKSPKLGCKHTCWRVTRVLLAAVLVGILVVNHQLHTVEVTTEAGTVRLKTAVYTLIRSPAAQQLWASLSRLLAEARHRGWHSTWQMARSHLDTGAEQRALLVLGLDEHARNVGGGELLESQPASRAKTAAAPASAEVMLVEIKRARRKLNLRWHPDKVAPDQKAESSERFREVQEAYETLTIIYEKRARTTASTGPRPAAERTKRAKQAENDL